TFFEELDLPVKVAAEFVRYEKVTSEGKARRLAAQHRREALSCQEIAALRRRAESASTAAAAGGQDKTSPSGRRPSSIFSRLVKLIECDLEGAVGELQQILGTFGYELVAVSKTSSGRRS